MSFNITIHLFILYNNLYWNYIELPWILHGASMTVVGWCSFLLDQVGNSHRSKYLRLEEQEKWQLGEHVRAWMAPKFFEFQPTPAFIEPNK